MAVSESMAHTERCLLYKGPYQSPNLGALVPFTPSETKGFRPSGSDRARWLDLGDPVGLGGGSPSDSGAVSCCRHRMGRTKSERSRWIWERSFFLYFSSPAVLWESAEWSPMIPTLGMKTIQPVRTLLPVETAGIPGKKFEQVTQR